MIASSHVATVASATRSTVAAAMPMTITLCRCCAGRPAAAMPTTMALPPASTTSMITTERPALSAPRPTRSFNRALPRPRAVAGATGGGGGAAERSGEPRRIMLMLSCATAATFLFCLWAQSFAALLLLSAAAGAFLSSLMPLGDNLALAGAYAGKLDYGRVRLWGSLAFIATLLIAGRVLEGRAADTLLYLLICGGTLTFAPCFALPAGSALARRTPSPAWRPPAPPP